MSAEAVGPHPLKGGIPVRGADLWGGAAAAAVDRIYRNCLYPVSPTFRDFFDLYSRSPVAGRMVETFPNYTWDTVPTVSDRGSSKRKTEFEAAWLRHSRQVFGDGAGGRQVFGPNGVFYSLDVLAGIGGEALLVIGFADGGRLEDPVVQGRDVKVLWHRVLHNGQFRVDEWDDDEGSLFYGSPEVFVTVPWRYGMDVNEPPPVPAGVRVHRSRCVLFREARGLDYGVSRIRKSFNTILDIMKVSGASAEVYWLAAYAGVKVETDPEGDLSEEDRAKMKAEVEGYNDGLSRSLLLQGAHGELMYPQIVSPKDHFEIQLKQLSLDSGIPQRFLIGAEEAKLASQQDTDNWNDRVNTRRMTVAVPQAILPYIARLVWAGALPAPSAGPSVEWTDKTTMPLIDRMRTGREAANAFSVYTAACAHKAIPFVDFLHKVMQFPLEEAMAIAAMYDAGYFERRAERMLAPAKDSQKDQPDTGGEGDNTNDR